MPTLRLLLQESHRVFVRSVTNHDGVRVHPKEDVETVALHQPLQRVDLFPK